MQFQVHAQDVFSVECLRLEANQCLLDRYISTLEDNIDTDRIMDKSLHGEANEYLNCYGGRSSSLLTCDLISPIVASSRSLIEDLYNQEYSLGRLVVISSGEDGAWDLATLTWDSSSESGYFSEESNIDTFKTVILHTERYKMDISPTHDGDRYKEILMVVDNVDTGMGFTILFFLEEREK
ncbi:MAG: hypothetical protein AAFN93_08260 [Bacteroidota bacterium]